MDSLELLEQRYIAERNKLERQLIIAKHLPTNDKTMSWTGENGWDAKGAPNDPIEKTCSLLPYIFHDHTAYKSAQHVSFKAPDGMKWHNGQGEPIYSKFRIEFVNKYFHAVVDAFRPFVIQTVAVKGSRYTGTFPTKFDFTKVREYEDAKEIGYGDCEIYVSKGLGEHSFTSGYLSFHVVIDQVGIIKIDLDVPGIERAAPIPHGVSHYGGQGPVSSVREWKQPFLAHHPVQVSFYGGGDHNNRSKSIRYLFDTIDDGLDCLGML